MISKALPEIIIVINDCRDENARVRQEVRIQSLFGIKPIFYGVSSDLEAAGALIDALNSAKSTRTLVLVNVAPRNGRARKWENGTPFKIFELNTFDLQATIVAPVDGECLSLLHEFNLFEKQPLIIDLEKTAKIMQEAGFIDWIEASRMIKTQFRSHDSIPLLVRYYFEGHSIAGEAPPDRLSAIFHTLPPNVAKAWCADSFGNLKTTFASSGFESQTGSLAICLTSNGKNHIVKNYKRLRDLPDGELGLVHGSSGHHILRFLELMVQGGSATKVTGIKAGDSIEISEIRRVDGIRSDPLNLEILGIDLDGNDRLEM